MKCDELKAEPMIINDDYAALYYAKESVDAAIMELKERVSEERSAKVDYKISANDLSEGLRDAYVDNRKLKRALWLARANDASSFAGLFSTLSYIEDDESRTYWIFGNKRKIVIDGLKCSRMETAYKWFCIWDDVANKCLKKAKEYKHEDTSRTQRNEFHSAPRLRLLRRNGRVV